ncbi:hypothetical protein WDV93_22975 [Pantoea ananatis]
MLRGLVSQIKDASTSVALAKLDEIAQGKHRAVVTNRAAGGCPVGNRCQHGAAERHGEEQHLLARSKPLNRPAIRVRLARSGEARRVPDVWHDAGYFRQCR